MSRAGTSLIWVKHPYDSAGAASTIKVRVFLCHTAEPQIAVNWAVFASDDPVPCWPELD